MRYVQLRAFHNVATCGGFSRAAAELRLTQPAISDQVRKLEEEYDVLLFNRHKKQVVLTPAGERLLEITRRLFDNEQQALDLLSETRALRSGTLRIVADAAHHLVGILAAFRAKYPGVSISVRSGNTETIIESLYRYEADVGVIGEVPETRDFEHIRLSTSAIIAFVSTDHGLARKSVLTFEELVRHPLVLREGGSRTRAMLEAAALAAGVVLRPAIEAEGREAVREIVASGAGVGFVSAAEFSEDARLVPIKVAGAEKVTMEEALICLKERQNGKLVQAFFGVAAQVARPEHLARPQR